MATPSLAMIPSGYKSGKVYSVLPTDGTGDLTFTRASSATRVNQSGLIETVATGVPRLDYTDGGCPSLLLEGQSTNLITYSEDFSNAFWNKTSATVATSTLVSPDGLQGSYKLIPDNGTGGNRSIGNSYTSLTGLHTHTCFAKKGEYDYLTLRTRNSPSAGVMFDLANGTLSVNLTSAVYVSSEIENYGNGWYRCSITLDPSQADTVGQLFISMSVGITGSEDNSFDGNGTSGVYIWGSQFENLSYPTSYIPTSGSTVTRIEDTASKTGLSSYINSTEGVVFFKGNLLVNDTSQIKSLCLSDGTSSNIVRIQTSGTSNQIYARIQIGGSSIIIPFTITDITQTFALAFLYKSGALEVYLNGSQIATDSSTFTFTNPLSVLDYSLPGGSGVFNSRTNDIRVYSTVLTSAELITLTTL